MKTFKPLIYLLAAVGLAYVFFSYILSSFIPSCENETIQSVLSPDKQREAKIVVEKCSNQSGGVLKLSLSNQTNSRKIDSVNIGVATAKDVGITWLSENRLQLAYSDSYQILQQPSEIDGVEIRFVSKASSIKDVVRQ
ncbi:hypothetical protein [Collimonas pratensis]|uniref:hypothetical protein n=1 Tax=Collimonas pratensis TaxID=279113 RepID=UPI0012370BCE|nr:hypothetical protein [Collimonas pratensis]